MRDDRQISTVSTLGGWVASFIARIFIGVLQPHSGVLHGGCDGRPADCWTFPWPTPLKPDFPALPEISTIPTVARTSRRKMKG